MGRNWNHEVFVQKAAQRLHEAKSAPENCEHQVGSYGEGRRGQAGLQSEACRARMSGGQKLPQDRCTHWIERRFFHDAHSSRSRRLGQHCVQHCVRCSVSVPPVERDRRLLLLGMPTQNHPPEKKSRKGSTVCLDPRGPEAFGHTHVDDFLIPFMKTSKALKNALKHLVHTLNLKQQSDAVVYCGRTFSKSSSLSQ